MATNTLAASMPRKKAATSVFNVVCAGVSAAVREAVLEFTGAQPGLQYLGNAQSQAALILALSGGEAALLVYSGRWLSREGDRGLQAVQSVCSGCRVLLVDAQVSNARLAGLLRFGLCGVVSREADEAAALAKALPAVAEGQLWFARLQLAAFVRQFDAPVHAPLGQGTDDVPDLTAREIMVLDRIRLGMSNKEIATSLGISEQTVKIHLQHIFQKFHLHRRADLILLR